MSFGSIEIGIELLTPLDQPVLVVDVRTVLFFQLLLLLFVWNTLTFSMTVSTTIPLYQDPLGVDVAALQGMQ